MNEGKEGGWMGKVRGVDKGRQQGGYDEAVRDGGGRYRRGEGGDERGEPVGN